MTQPRLKRASFAFISIATLSLVAGACGGAAQVPATTAPVTPAPTIADVATPSPALTAAPTASSPPTPTPTPAPTVLPLVATMYFMGFSIETSQVTYDPMASTVRVDANFTNLGSAEASLLVLPLDGQVSLTGAGQIINMGMDNTDSNKAAGGATIKGAFTTTVSPGFVLEDFVLTLGLPVQHQSTLPLKAGATATTELPRDFGVTGSVKIGDMAKVTFKSGQVVAATCTGAPDAISFAPAKKGELSILLSVVSQNINKQWDTITSSYVTGPDGIAAKGTPGGRYMSSLQTFRNDVLCYTVSEPVKGTYKMKWTAERTAKTATFSFDVP